MDTLAQDVRFAIRSLAKAPLFTALCVLCLSIGIGVNANVYSAVYAVFLRPFAYAEPERLVSIEESVPKRGVNDLSLAFATFRDVQRQVTAFEDVAAVSFRSLTLTDGEEPLRLRGELVSWNLFPMLAVTPSIGRLVRVDEDRRGAPGVVLLGHGLWEKRYGGDSAIVGRVIALNGAPHTVVGVMPRHFEFPENTEAWIPMAPLLDGHSRETREVRVFGRLRVGVDVEAATGQLSSLFVELERLYPKAYEGRRAYAQPLREEFMPPDVRLVVSAMMGAVTFVLLIACANVANLLLARATTRSREMAIRTALGASRGRIVRQLLTESVLLALIACPLGIAIAFWLLDAIVASMPEGGLPYYVIMKIDGPVLLYAVVISIVTGIVFGMAPALQSLRGSLVTALKEGGLGSGTSGGRQRLRMSLTVAEVALSLVLLVGAALFVRSFFNVQHKKGGIDTANMLTMRIYMGGVRYDSGQAIAARVADVILRIEALPGVTSATASNQIPLSGGGSSGAIEIEGRPVANAMDAPSVSWSGVTEGWFRTLGVPLRAGRTFTADEARDSSGVVVINEVMAKRFWPGADPLGRRFRLLDDAGRQWFTVIGVAADFYPDELDSGQPIAPSFYASFRYLPTRNTGVMIKSAQDATPLTAAIRNAIRASDPSLPVFEVMSMEELRQFGFWSQRLFGWMFSMFGIVAVVLASVGVYGVIAYSVSQRTREIGVRVALGAQPRDVIRLVLAQGAALALSGIGIGLLGSLGVTRLIQSLLIDVSPTDALSFGTVTLFLAGVALLASYVPARRATRVDPLTALRAE